MECTEVGRKIDGESLAWIGGLVCEMERCNLLLVSCEGTESCFVNDLVDRDEMYHSAVLARKRDTTPATHRVGMLTMEPCDYMVKHCYERASRLIKAFKGYLARAH
jgi:hypothetical protein